MTDIATDADREAARRYCAVTGYVPEHGLLKEAFARHRLLGQKQASEPNDAAKVAMHHEMTDVELANALTSEGIYVYGPEASRFERMFAVVMNLRAMIEGEG